MTTRRTRLLAAAAVLTALVAACSGEASGPSLAEGDPAPGFTLRSAEGPSVSLNDYRGERPVLLYFSVGPG